MKEISTDTGRPGAAVECCTESTCGPVRLKIDISPTRRPARALGPPRRLRRGAPAVTVPVTVTGTPGLMLGHSGWQALLALRLACAQSMPGSGQPD